VRVFRGIVDDQHRRTARVVNDSYVREGCAEKIWINPRLAGDFPLAVDMVMSKPFAVREFREAVHRLTTKS
jgi:hypothetical protein